MTDYLEQLWLLTEEEQQEQTAPFDLDELLQGMTAPQVGAPEKQLQSGTLKENDLLQPLQAGTDKTGEQQLPLRQRVVFLQQEAGTEQKSRIQEQQAREQGARESAMFPLMEQVAALARQETVFTTPSARAPGEMETADIPVLRGVQTLGRGGDTAGWDLRDLDRAAERDSRRYDGGFSLY